MSVDGIDNIGYLDMIDDYVGGFVRLLIDRAAVEAQFPEVGSVATDVDPETETEVDVLGKPDRGLLEQQELIIADGEVVVAPVGYDSGAAEGEGEEARPNALTLLYGDDSDEEEEEESGDGDDDDMFGGAGPKPERNIVGMRVK